MKRLFLFSKSELLFISPVLEKKICDKYCVHYDENDGQGKNFGDGGMILENQCEDAVHSHPIHGDKSPPFLFFCH